MFDILRDPAWNGIAGIATILALFFAVFQDKSVRPLSQKTRSVIKNALIGVLVVLPGISLEMTIESLFNGGIPLIIYEWQDVLSSGILQWLWLSLAFAMFPGVATALIGSTGKSKVEIRNRSIAGGIITLCLTDISLAFLRAVGVAKLKLAPLTFTLLSDILGGVLIGYIISYLLINIPNPQEQSVQETNNVRTSIKNKK